MIRVWVATAFALSALALVGAATAGSSADSDPGGHCAAGDASMRDGQLDQAVDAYLEALRADAACADAKLRAAAAAKRLEARLCAEGDDRAELGKDGEAQRKYVDALNVNVASDCAREGIAARPESKSRGARFFDYLPEFPIHLGSLALMLLVAFALFGLVRSLFLRKASLVIKPFADEAVNPKVGTAFAGLIEEQLVSVWRMRQGLRDDGYILDLVVADVELLSADESLDDAVGELAQVPQFGIVAGLVAFVDRLFIQRRLSAVGDLLPEGDRGCGVALSLFKRKSLQARGTLWERPEAETAPDAAGEPSPVEPKPVLEGVLSFFKRMALEVRRTSWERPEAETAPGVAPASPAVEQKSESETGESPAEAAAEAGTGKGLAASRYYGLAGAAVAWVQYEAARALEARVGVITSSAKSFSLLSAGLDEHRAAAAAAALSAGLDEHRAAAAAAEAETLYRKAERHYRDALEDDGENVAALFNLALFVARHDAKFDDALSRLKAARSILERRYSEVSPARAKPATRRREELADPTWYRIRYALAAQRLHKGDYARAQAAALELITTTSVVLAEIGWRWVGRRPPWFMSWYKRGPAWLGHAARRFFGRPRRRTIDADWELARLLAWTVEPAAVLLWWSARVEQNHPPATPTPEKVDKPTRPLDRRKEKNLEWLERYLVELSAKQEARWWFKRACGWLGRSRWRPPKMPKDRVQYNLACLFSRLASHAQESAEPQSKLERSAKYLEDCFADMWGARRGELARWASQDPGLAGLRTQRQEQFKAIVTRLERDNETPSVGHIRLRNAAAAVLSVLGLGVLAVLVVALVASIWWDLPLV